jgi:hypothetical protein
VEDRAGPAGPEDGAVVLVAPVRTRPPAPGAAIEADPGAGATVGSNGSLTPDTSGRRGEPVGVGCVGRAARNDTLGCADGVNSVRVTPPIPTATAATVASFASAAIEAEDVIAAALASAPSAEATIAGPEEPAATDAAPPPAGPAADASTRALTLPVSATGAASTRTARCLRTSLANCWQDKQRSRWARTTPRAAAFPRVFASCSRTSEQA